MAQQAKQVERRSSVVIRFAGDSGDGMQLTGDRFTQETAAFGNDLSTLPNFPAEIRAPAGTLPGVSSFQLHFADHHVLTPGDRPDVLVAMNPAALRANVADLRAGGTLIVDTHDFGRRNLAKAGYDHDPLEGDDLDHLQVHGIDLTALASGAVEGFELSRKDASRTKNMFALGLLSWMYGRPVESTIEFVQNRFASKPDLAAANIAAFRAGWAFGETTEAFAVSYEVPPAPVASGRYRNITGNKALAYGVVAAGHASGLPVFLGAYPITPASDVLHELSRLKSFGVTTFQAEDEIAGIGAALGAAYGGHLAFTSTSGPGVALKSETIGLAVMLEVPLVVVDVQRGGPSTGLPTKTEQSDLLQALHGRNGEAPVPVVAPATPSECFAMAIEAARIAVTHRTPVMLLSDGYLANGSEPWPVPDVASLPRIDPAFADGPNTPEGFAPYARDPETLARPWAPPGVAGLEHRIGGIEKSDVTGDISYEPENHDLMVRTRQAKVDAVAASVPPTEVHDPTGDARILLLGWGSTYGPIAAGARLARDEGTPVAQAHVRHLNPLPPDLGDVLRRYDRVVVPEMNSGQLAMVLRARYLVDVRGYNKVRGMPFGAEELARVVAEHALDLEDPR